MYDIFPPPYGTLEVVCGPMFSGKTERLIQLAQRAEYAKLRVQAFKPKIDDRYDENNLVSHDHCHSYPGFAIVDVPDLRLAICEETNVVVFDEVQFFSIEIVDLILELVDRGVRVVAGGLDLDFLMKPFEVVSSLMAHADVVTKLTAVCGACHSRPGSYSYRLVKDGARILIGAEGVYEPRCRACYKEGMRKG